MGGGVNRKPSWPEGGMGGTVKYNDLSTFFDFVSFGAPMEHRAYVSLEEWYAFEAESTERALREWCNANQIHLAENGGQQSA